MRPDLARRATAEAVGTALLVAAVVGSGVAATRLSPSDVGLQLLENATATAAALVGLVHDLGTLTPGKLADLIVVDGDPAADLSLLARPQEALKAVIRDGAFVIDRLPPRAGRAAA